MDSREDVKFDIYYKHSKKSKDIKQSAHIEFGATPKLIEALKDPSSFAFDSSFSSDQLPFRFAGYLNPLGAASVNAPKSMDSAVRQYNKIVQDKNKKVKSKKKGKRRKTEIFKRR